MAEGIDYPRNIVWFIRAEEPKQSASEGSAVAIRLRRNGEIGGAGKLYLLTCAHVVRKRQGSDGEFGPCCQRIRAWAPGSSYSDTDEKIGVVVKPVQDVIPTSSNTKDFHQRPLKLEGHFDWVLLEFEDRNIAEPVDRPSLRQWQDGDVQAGLVCSIIGYPGGSKSKHFTPPDPKAIPTLGFATVPVTRLQAGLVSFEGVETREGMSGGGVFDAETKTLVGLHRSRDDLTLNLQAVSISQIATIVEKEFSFESDAPRKRADDREIATSVEDGVKPESDSEKEPINDIHFLTMFLKSSGTKRGGLVLLVVLCVFAIKTVFFPRIDDISFHLSAKELILDDQGDITHRPPFAAATFSVHAANFAFERQTGGETNSDGSGQITIENPAIPEGVAPQVRFLVTRAPEHLAPLGSLVTTQYGAVREGESLRLLSEKACEIKNGIHIDVDVIPEKLASRYYALKVNEMIIDVQESGESVGEKYQQANMLIGDLGISEERTKADILRNVTEHLLEERPSIPVMSVGADPKTEKYRAIAEEVAPSVCYVKAKPRSMPSSFMYSGFVVSRNLVLTTSFDADETFEAVAFGTHPNSGGERMFQVGQFWRYPEFSVALLLVPGLDVHPLELAAENPFKAGRAAELAVVGYCSDDRRLPRILREALSLNDSTLKRIMPGNCLSVDPSGERFTAMKHDATTSGGVAGSPLIDRTTGLVVGIHTSGIWNGNRKSNGALPIWELLANDDFATRIGHYQRVAIDLLKQNDWPVQINSFNDTLLVQVSPKATNTGRWDHLVEILKASKTPIDLDLTEYPDSLSLIAVLPEIESLHTLRIRGDNDPITWQWISAFKSLSRLFLTDCDEVRPFSGSEGDARQPLANLKVLGLDGSADWIASLNDFACFPNLTDLDISGRTSIFSLQGINKLKNLATLRIANSSEIQNLEEISMSGSLKILTLDRSSFANGELPEIQSFSRRDTDAGIDFVRGEIGDQ